MKKYKPFIIVFATIDWVKPAWPGELILLTTTLLMGGGSAGDAGRAR